MFADPSWIASNALLTGGVVLTVIVVKVLVVAGSLRLARQTWSSSLAAGFCLSQVGEFAFVIAGTARGS